MVILNIWGDIEPTIVSSKLGLYISNLRGSPQEDWAETLVEEFKKGLRVSSVRLGKSVDELSNDIAKQYDLTSDRHGRWIDSIVNKLIYIDFEYEYEDMPLGDWKTNCFDGRLCEHEYCEKMLDFFAVFSGPWEGGLLPLHVPMWVYSSSSLDVDYQRLLWFGGQPLSSMMDGLKQWGELLDSFLQNRADYLLLDYLVNAFYFDGDMDEYGLFKRYSLCQLFLEKEHEWELDWKLAPFLSAYAKDVKEAEEQARGLRRLRNKLAHGDFKAFDCELEKFAQRFMDGLFWFDYTEYSRRNWAIGHACHLLNSALSLIVGLLFTDRRKLDVLKSKKRA